MSRASSCGDDRGVEARQVQNVRQVANRTFYRREAGWVDAEVKEIGRVSEEIRRWSPRFYELVRTTTAEENARLAQAGTLILEIQGRVVRIVDES